MPYLQRPEVLADPLRLSAGTGQPLPLCKHRSQGTEEPPPHPPARRQPDSQGALLAAPSGSLTEEAWSGRGWTWTHIPRAPASLSPSLTALGTPRPLPGL